MTDAITINNHLNIPMSELRFKFARSGGKGGQNVNKVETKVELLFDIANSPSLSEYHRDIIQKNLRNQMDSGEVLHIVSQESRSQWKNREDAVRKFTEILRKALKPRKRRILTKVSSTTKQRRLDEKKKRSVVKQLRRANYE